MNHTYPSVEYLVGADWPERQTQVSDSSSTIRVEKAASGSSLGSSILQSEWATSLKSYPLPTMTGIREEVKKWHKCYIPRLFSRQKTSDVSTDDGVPGFIDAPWTTIKRSAKKYLKFVGPGMMVSIAYMDPGNYSTDVAAGAQKRFALLFMVFLSNLLAVYLQTLAIRLGTVTGQDLAVNCRRHFPKYVNWVLYIFAEAAIMATDIAEIIGTAIALNILLKIPLIAGVFITIIDVFVVLLAYRPGRGMTTVRIYEYMVACLLFGVVICFAIELAHIPKQNVGHIFRGYVPSSEVISGDGLYLSCGILGATVMPHSLYLGSALVRPRVQEYDQLHSPDGGLAEFEDLDEETEDAVNEKYQPSHAAIKYAMKYSTIEVAVSLCTLALFVNSAIIVVAGSTLYQNAEAADADLYSIYNLLRDLLSPASGIVFMIALLCSGQSAGIICTIAGQIVCEGHINMHVRPWIRRIITRLIALIPCIIVVAIVGKSGLSAALNGSQVALSILLPFLSAPLIWLTSSKKVMSVAVSSNSEGNSIVDMSNGWFSKLTGLSIWLFIAMLNVYLIVHLGLYGS